MPNPFVHVELNTTNIAAAKSFYGALFGWNLQDVPMGGDRTYTMISVGEGTGGGMQAHPVAGAPSSWLAYVDVGDIHAATEKPPKPRPHPMPYPLGLMRAPPLSLIS